MPPALRLPDAVCCGPFTASFAASVGVSEKVLRGSRFARLYPCVWVHVDHAMSDLDHIVAAELAMPERAQVSHVTRIQRLGLDVLDRRPFHFTIAGELHLDVQDVFLHRTKVLPPLDDVGVSPAAAFVQLCADARMIDAIKVGDWLLRNRHMTAIEVGEVAGRDRWRPGAVQARRVLPFLDAGSRSIKESETRAVLVFAGLPRPELNKYVRDERGVFLGCGDLVYALWKLLVEYEGSQHLLERAQWNRDIDRYGRFRDAGWRYVQVTSEKLDLPKKLVSEVFGQLMAGGYQGPAPVFGRRWATLFEPISTKPVSRR